MQPVRRPPNNSGTYLQDANLQRTCARLHFVLGGMVPGLQSLSSVHIENHPEVCAYGYLNIFGRDALEVRIRRAVPKDATAF